MNLINDDVTLSLLSEHCNMVQMIMNRDNDPELRLDFNSKTIQQLLDWLQTEELNCQSIDEIKEFCQLADYLDCHIYDFYDYLIDFMKQNHYQRFGHVISYCYELLNQSKNPLIDDYDNVFDKYRPLIYNYKYDYHDYQYEIAYPEEYTEPYPTDWLTIINILNLPILFLKELDNIYDVYFKKFKKHDQLAYSLYTLTLWDEIPAINPEQKQLNRYYKLDKDLHQYWIRYGIRDC